MIQAVVLAGVGIALLVVAVRLWGGQNYFDALVSALGALATVATLIPKVSPRAYLTLRRLHAWLTFATVSWTVRLTAVGELSDDYLDRLDGAVIANGGKARKIVSRPNYRYYEVPRLSSIEVTIVPFGDQQSQQVDAQIIAPGVKYSNAKALFDGQALDFAKALREASRTATGATTLRDESFQLMVDYGRNNNPFYGMFLHWMGYGEVTSFRVAIRLGDRTVLTVLKESAELTSADPVRFAQAAADLIGLSGRVLRLAQPPA